MTCAHCGREIKPGDTISKYGNEGEFVHPLCGDTQWARKEVIEELTKLRAENERLRKALEFYAEPLNWSSTGRGLSIHWIDKITDDYNCCTEDKRRFHGGKKARHALEDTK